MSIIKKLTAGCLAVLMLAGGAVLPDGVLSDMDTAVVASAATTSPYSGKNEVFDGKNTGYNVNCKHYKYNNSNYQSIPMIDTFVNAITNSATLKKSGVNYANIYIGQSYYNSDTKKNIINSYVDSYFVSRLKTIEDANIKIGLIWNSCAYRPCASDTVYQEAESVYNAYKKIKAAGVTVDLPIFYAMEFIPDESYGAKYNTQAALNFYNRLRTLGYKGEFGIYFSSGGISSQVDINTVLNQAVKYGWCVWEAAYDNYPSNPTYQNYSTIHQYDGSPDGKICYRNYPNRVNGIIDCISDLDMAFVERPTDISGSISLSGTNQNTVACNGVSGVDGYRFIVTYKNGKIVPFDQMTTQKGANFFTATDDMKSITIKTLKVDKYGFVAESLKGVSTPASWHSASISSCSVSIPKTSYVYTGSAIKPAVTVKYNGKTLKSGTDYTVSYKNNKAVGTATITVTGKGDYSGTKTRTFSIVNKAISTVKVQYTTGYAYTGLAIKPNITVTGNDGKTLKKDTDYTVSYSNNINIGSSAKITVKGKGSYIGSKTITFTIKPKMPSYKAVQNSKGILFTWETPAEISELSASVKKNIGYEIMWSKNKDFSDAKTANLTSATFTSYNTNVQGFLTSGTWYVKCRAYIKVGNNSYGNWSSKTVTIK